MNNKFITLILIQNKFKNIHYGYYQIQSRKTLTQMQALFP